MGNAYYTAVILAAGYSARMGRFKPVLPLGEKRVIEHTVDVFRANRIADILVVTGYRAPDISRVLRTAGVRIVENPDYGSGMFSSVKAGVAALDTGRTKAFFVTPADICLTRPLTIRLLAAAYRKHPDKIIYPCFKGERGHPPLIPAPLAAVILESEPGGGLKSVLERYEHLAVECQVPDRHMLLDMNRPADYEAACERYRYHDVPSAGECDVLLNDVCAVSADIVAHCREVARVSVELGAALRQVGVDLDLDLIRAAARLHDIARGRKDHANAGARLLADMGFSRVGRIVAQHTDLDFNPAGEISAAEIVYLSDKLIRQDRRTSLERRFSGALKKYGRDPAARKAVLGRWETALAVKRKLENALGASISEGANGRTSA